MTIEAKIETESGTQSFELLSHTPLAHDPIIDGVLSDLVILDSNAARIEHYRMIDDHRNVCGRGPVLHKNEITDKGIEVVVAKGSAGEVVGKVVWKRDSILGNVRKRIGEIRRELDLVSQG